MSKADQTVRELLARAKLPGGVGVRFKRLYPGYGQRSAGAWSWCAVDGEGRELCGSPHPLHAFRGVGVEVEYSYGVAELHPGRS